MTASRGFFDQIQVRRLNIDSESADGE
jgi:hypothetical protein